MPTLAKEFQTSFYLRHAVLEGYVVGVGLDQRVTVFGAHVRLDDAALDKVPGISGKIWLVLTAPAVRS
ncbi:hypothetical protein [Nocardia sp. NPDC050717]|uniref:hypothetical protein n=1 Tax=Nocardia sp. NPDC050717 TaxID=3157221 RepID=UPI0033DABAFD